MICLMRREIDISRYTYLTSIKLRTAQFYMLSKIHKHRKLPPGWPIVSGNGCPTERISEFIDFFLQPLIKCIPSYIKDTTHFLQCLMRIGNLPPGSILGTLDVASLYTNIPNKEGMEAADTALQAGLGSNPHPLNSSLINLLEKVLKRNILNFNEPHFLQVGGTAMGTNPMPTPLWVGMRTSIFIDTTYNHLYGRGS